MNSHSGSLECYPLSYLSVSMDGTARLQQAISQMAIIIDSLERLPQQYLTPFANVLSKEARTLTAIADSVQPYHEELSAALSIATATWPPEMLNTDYNFGTNSQSQGAIEPGSPLSPSEPSEEFQQHLDVPVSQQATQALKGVAKSIEPLKKALQTMGSDFAIHNADVSKCRVAHLYPLHPTGRQPHREHSQDHILAVLASLSLEEDLYTFEVNNGWLPKRDRILESVRNGCESYRQNSPNHTAAFAAFLSLPRATYPRVKAGLRLGMKLSILQRLAHHAKFGAGVCLLLGFEPQKMARLSYRSFGHLSAIFQNPAPQDELGTVRAFSHEIDSRFMHLQREYCDLFCHLSRLEATSATDVTRASDAEIYPIAQQHNTLWPLLHTQAVSFGHPLHSMQRLPIGMMNDDLVHIHTLWSSEEADGEWDTYLSNF